MTPRTPSLCVVAPVYNEGEMLEHFYDSLKSALETVEGRYTWTLIFVIDPSQDNTEEVARALAADDNRVSALLMSRRVGHQMSLVAGMDHCTADVCVTMDADLQHPPELIPEMLALFEGGADVVQTVRIRTEGLSPVKVGLSRAFYRAINRVSEVDFIESGADFRLLSKRVLVLFQTQLRERSPFLRGLVQWVGFPTATLPFVAPARHSGTSKYSIGRSAGLALSGLVSFSKTPLRIGLVAGVLIAMLAAAIGVFSLLPALLGASVPAGWTTLAVLMALLSSAQLLTLGLLGVYIGAIFDEVKQRPPYLVRDTINPPQRDPDGA